VVLLFAPPFGGWVPGDVPGAAAPGAGELFGDCGEGLLGLGVADPGLGVALPGGGVAVPGVGAAVPGVGVALPGAGFVLPGESVCPCVVLWPEVPAWPPADPALPEPPL
jgi:hypothetical protein